MMQGIGMGAIAPSEVIPPGGYTPVEACPYCGVKRLDGPEGASWLADFHCWKCGYRPDVNSSVSDYQRQQQFKAFTQWLATQMEPDTSHPTLNAPTGDVDMLRERIGALEAQLAANKGA